MIITLCLTDIENTVKGYYDQFFATKLKNLNELNK